MSDKVYVIKSTFSAMINGRRVSFHKGTTIREGHPLLESLSEMVEPWIPDHEVEAPEPKRKAAPKTEQATAAPGEVRELSNGPAVSDE